MNKVPTAEDIMSKKFSELKASFTLSDMKECMIQFAKLHVKAALKAAYKNQGMSWTNSTDEEVKLDLFMRNSYPLEKIK